MAQWRQKETSGAPSEARTQPRPLGVLSGSGLGLCPCKQGSPKQTTAPAWGLTEGNPSSE